MPIIQDMTGKRFGRLVVVEMMPRNYRPTLIFWRCKCDCGNETIVRASALQMKSRKPPQSCGCWRHEFARTHGRTRIDGRHSPEFETWRAMWKRCTLPNTRRWKHYGGRGISVCERWKDFALFCADMGDKPSPKHSLDRINNDGNYEPGNCRWATASEQNRNSRRFVGKHSRTITAFGETLTVAEWARRTGINPITLYWRVKHWPSERVFVQPRVYKRGNHQLAFCAISGAM